MKFSASIKKFLLVVLVLFLCASSFLPVSAQEEVIIESLLVDIWPEYDRPSTLVIYHISLGSSTSLPAELEIRIPSSAGEPHAVAMQDPSGLYTLSYDRITTGLWQNLRFTTPVPDVRIEFYDPIEKDSQQRNFIFRWPGDYTVNNFSLQVQQPPSATNVVIKPDMGSGRSAEDGLTYYTYIAGKVNAGTTFELSVSYAKDNDDLTSEGQFQAVEPSQPVNTSTAGRFNPMQALPWVIGGIGLVMIAAGIIWYSRTGRIPQTAQRHRHTRKAGQANEENGLQGSFCHQCGKKAAPNDLFCRACGTKLK